jgi:VWFA-related protein
LREGDRVIVAPFNHKVGAITGPTEDVATVTEAIEAMRAGGGTAILDAVAEGTRLLDAVEGRRVIVLITDGFDENSTMDVPTAIQRSSAAQVTLYAVAVGGVTGVSLNGESTLRQLAARTGGRVFFPWRDADLAAVVASVAVDTHNRYVISYTPTNQKKDGTWREIVLQVPEGYHARTRAGYQAASPPPIRPTIEFSVTDTARALVEVAAEDIEVYEDGVPQAVDAFQEAVDPVSIVMTLDASGSMVKSADAVRQTAREFVAAVRPEDSLAMMTFADEPLLAHVLERNRQYSMTAIDKYTPAGGTALYDALWNSLMHVKAAPGRRAVVVLTDGKDENNPGTAPGSVHTLSEVLDLAQQVGAAIFAVGLGKNVEEDTLQRLAKASGGAAYFSADLAELSAQFRRVVENLRQRYVLSYTSTNSEQNGAWRKVEVRPRKTGLVVATAGGYFAPEE